MKSIKELSNTNKRSISNNRKRYLSMKEKYLNEIDVEYDIINIFEIKKIKSLKFRSKF